MDNNLILVKKELENLEQESKLIFNDYQIFYDEKSQINKKLTDLSQEIKELESKIEMLCTTSEYLKKKKIKYTMYTLGTIIGFMFGGTILSSYSINYIIIQSCVYALLSTGVYYKITHTMNQKIKNKDIDLLLIKKVIDKKDNELKENLKDSYSITNELNHLHRKYENINNKITVKKQEIFDLEGISGTIIKTLGELTEEQPNYDFQLENNEINNEIELSKNFSLKYNNK